MADRREPPHNSPVSKPNSPPSHSGPGLDPLHEVRRITDSGRTSIASRVHRPLLVLGFLGGCTVLELGRQSGVPSWHSLWAEDGTVFLSDALNKPFFSTLFAPYNGYALVVPRVAAALVSVFPLADAAWLIALVSSIIVSLVALFVFDASRVVLGHASVRLGLALAVVLLPAEAFETTANLANIHWYLLFACFWALASTDTSSGRLVARSAFALFAPLSSPLAVLFIPVAAWSLATRRTKAAFIPVMFFTTGLIAQWSVVLTAPSNSTDAISSPFHPSDLVPLFGSRVAGSFLVGDRFLDLAWRALGDVFVYGSIVVVACVLGLTLRRVSGAKLRFGLACVGEAVAFFTVELAVRGTSMIWPPTDALSLGGSRYFVLPILFLLAGFAVGVDDALGIGGVRSWPGWSLLVALWFGGILLLNYSFENPRSGGPVWVANLQQAELACPTAGGGYVNVPIAPGGAWLVRVPCR